MTTRLSLFLRLDIWVAAISKDDWWKQCRLASPEQMDSTLFYRAVILAHNSGESQLYPCCIVLQLW